MMVGVRCIASRVIFIRRIRQTITLAGDRAESSSRFRYNAALGERLAPGPPNYYCKTMSNSPRNSIFDTAAIDTVRRALRIEPGHIRRLRTKLCKHFAGPDAALAELPVEIRDEFAARVELRQLERERRFDSEIDGASKLVFLTRGQRRIESVLLRAGTGRVALCISSQVGCAANCDFCATGKMGLLANLTADEMLDQIVQAGEQLALEDRKIRNIVLMGMGEPFHNENSLYATIEALLAPEAFHHPASRVLVSTVGIPVAMRRFASRFPQVNLALSLHSVDQGIREQIIPLAKHHSLEELRSTLIEIQQANGRSVMIEYLMLAGLNDSLADAKALAEWTDGLAVHLNLIPFNSIAGASHLVGSDRKTRERFASVLKNAGKSTTLRYSMGADIEAACGQLVQQLDREGVRMPA